MSITVPSTSTQSTTSVSGGASTAPSGSISTTQQSGQTSLTTSTQTDTEITTFVQQIDTQGPIVLERITTQFADIACTPANARLLVEGLRTGSAVTLTADGKTATFTPSGNLGYGETYIALALAAEALRAAGITGCATPEQWKAVLMGGPLAASGTTSTTTTTSATSSSSSNFPGILALRSQGQGWGQIAKTTNVQLGQVVSSARKLNLGTSNSNDDLTPTGRTSAEMNADRKPSGTSATPSANSASGEDKKDSEDDKDNGRGNDKDASATPALPQPSTNPSDSDRSNR